MVLYKASVRILTKGPGAVVCRPADVEHLARVALDKPGHVGELPVLDDLRVLREALGGKHGSP